MADEKNERGLATTDGAGMAMERSAETAASASAAMVVAEIQAAYAMAQHRPRSVDRARQRILKDCDRPGFAENAVYEIPNRGSGLTVDFADAARMHWGNIRVREITTYDDNGDAATPGTRIIEVSATDIETNSIEAVSVTVKKMIQRKYPEEGRRVFRKIKKGKPGNQYTLYEIEASEDDLLGLVNSRCSKARRNVVNRIIPKDIREEAYAKCMRVKRAEFTEDPDAAKRRVLDGFFSIGIDAGEVEKYLGHSMDGCNEAELEELRGVYRRVDGGERWHIILKEHLTIDPDEKPPKKGTDAAKAALKKKNQKPVTTERRTKKPADTDADADADKAKCGEYAKMITAGGDETPDEYLAETARALGGPDADLGDFTADDWGKMRKHLLSKIAEEEE